jgi:hypothetical protein
VKPRSFLYLIHASTRRVHVSDTNNDTQFYSQSYIELLDSYPGLPPCYVAFISVLLHDLSRGQEKSND